MSQERLSVLSLLSAENEIARNINISKAIEIFASKNTVRSERFK